MKKCIYCEAENDDSADFCFKCGKNLNEDETSLFITKERIIRLLSLLDINHGDATEGTPVTENPNLIIDLIKFILSIDRNLEESEIQEINAAINNIEKENISDSKSGNKTIGNRLFKGFFYNFTGNEYSLSDLPDIPYEDERFEIITELLFRPILENKLFNSSEDIKSVIMCIGLLCACDARFTRSKERLFEKIKRMEMVNTCNEYKLEKLSIDQLKGYLIFLCNQHSGCFKGYMTPNYIRDINDSAELLNLLLDEYKEIQYVSENKILFSSKKTVKGNIPAGVLENLKSVEVSIKNYIDVVIDLSKELCKIEQNINKLEQSTDCIYLEIKKKVLAEISKEKQLIIDTLNKNFTNNLKEGE